MSDGAAMLAGASVSLTICVFIWMARIKNYPSFGRWWNGEGIACFVLLALLLFAILGSRFL